MPALTKRQGAISTVSSIVSQDSLGVSGIALYGTTKDAVNGFTVNLVPELSAKGIRINAVLPGTIDTPIFDKADPDPQKVQELKKMVVATTPLHRLGTPEEIADVIVTQVESTDVTGALWTVDGGVSVV